VKLRQVIARKLFDSLYAMTCRRGHDFAIGQPGNRYLLRWYIIPRNPVFNIYLHHFLRSDDDRALHDHPWFNLSFLLHGRYREHTIGAGGINYRREFVAGDIKFRFPRFAHRVELIDGPCWSLFITGPRMREWGFHCTEKGWVHWRTFTSPNDSGATGRGCE
jgi:hypothetical protein